MTKTNTKKAGSSKRKVEDPCQSPEKNCKSLIIEGSKYKTILTSKFENRKNWEAPDPRKLYSFIPGTILRILVKEGQEIKENQQVLVLEAMKMRNKVEFPIDGKVKKIYVKEGERIPKGFLMMEVE